LGRDFLKSNKLCNTIFKYQQVDKFLGDIMVKGAILGTSIAALLFLMLTNMIDYFRLNSIGSTILIGILIILWILLLIMVFKDVKKNNNKTIWIAVTLFFGGLGGVIYAIVAKDNEVTAEESEKMRTGNFKNAAIFNYILATILLLICLLTIINGASYVTLIMLGLAVIFFILGKYLWKK
jgi:VanZ family protein